MTGRFHQQNIVRTHLGATAASMITTVTTTITTTASPSSIGTTS